MKLNRKFMPLKMTYVPWFLIPYLQTTLKWRTFRLLKWMRNLQQSKWHYDMLYIDIILVINFQFTSFCKNNTNVECC